VTIIEHINSFMILLVQSLHSKVASLPVTYELLPVKFRPYISFLSIHIRYRSNYSLITLFNDLNNCVSFWQYKKLVKSLPLCVPVPVVVFLRSSFERLKITEKALFVTRWKTSPNKELCMKCLWRFPYKNYIYWTKFVVVIRKRNNLL